jgi:hypothetical protein
MGDHARKGDEMNPKMAYYALSILAIVLYAVAMFSKSEDHLLFAIIFLLWFFFLQWRSEQVKVTK